MRRDLVALLVSMALVAGCGAEQDSEEQTGVETEASTRSRSDYVSEIIVGAGDYGLWHEGVYCDEGMWPTGFKLRVEGDQGGNGDDTALNSVSLVCTDRSGDRDDDWIVSHEGLWGDWGTPANCPGGRNLIGAVIKIESPQGGGDDTGANDVEFMCAGRGITTIRASNGMGWGTWGQWVQCPTSTAVCGLSIRFEDDLGGGDDTAMNGLKLYCCRT